MTTSADIVNRALALSVAQYTITGSPPTFDGSPAGIAAGILYPPAWQMLLRTQDFEFSRAIEPLAPAGLPSYPWAYAYMYPADCLKIRTIQPSAWAANDPQPIRWTEQDQGIFPQASGYIYFPANPAPANTITLNSVVWTFVAGTPAAYQVQIQSTLPMTLMALVTALQASVNPLLTVATYFSDMSNLRIQYGPSGGTAGNTYTLAATGTAVPNGAALTGGLSAITNSKIILTNVPAATLVYTTSNVSENIWDYGFQEAVVRYLSSQLSLALSGRPDLSRAALEQAGNVLQSAEAKDS